MSATVLEEVGTSVDVLHQTASLAKLICQDAGVDHCDLSLVTGTGWRTAVDCLGTPLASLRASDYPGFVRPTIEGHDGLIQFFRVGRLIVMVFLGRVHLYEFPGWSGMSNVAYCVEVAHAAGSQAHIHTSAVGLVRLDWPIGQSVIIGDSNAYVTGFPSHLIGAPFHDVTSSYDPELRRLFGSLGQLPEATFAQIRGPIFQTVAEANCLRSQQIDVVGMSGLVEKEAAVRLGLRFCHLAIGTDYAGTPATHEGIQEVVFQQAAKMGTLIKAGIKQM